MNKYFIICCSCVKQTLKHEDKLLKREAKDLKTHFSKEDLQVAKKRVTGRSASLVTEEMELTSTERCLPLHTQRHGCQKKSGNNQGWSGYEERETLCPAGGNTQRCSYFGKRTGSSSQSYTQNYHLAQQFHSQVSTPETRRHMSTQTCTQTFTAALFLINKERKEPKRPPTKERINKMRHPYDGTPLRHKEEMRYRHIDSMDAPGKHHEHHTFYDSL